jgi:arsenite-transporting ATPase
VGKTAFAGAAAIGLARQGRRTLLVSTNPLHSLSGLFGRDMLGKHVAVEGVPNLWAYEIDTRQSIERSKAEIREKIRWFLKFADITTKADDFVESATMNPAFEESAMFENMIDVMFKNECDAYVFDTAPAANARRLLGMSTVYSLWVNKMLKSREEARTLRELLSFTKKKQADPLMDYLISFRERMEHARVLLTDPALTAFFFVTLAEALPIAVVTRFIRGFKDFGIPVGGVLVNMPSTLRRSVRTPPSSSRIAWPCSRSTCRRSGGCSTTASAPSCRCLRPRSAACRCSSACATPSTRPTARSPRPVTAPAGRTKSERERDHRGRGDEPARTPEFYQRAKSFPILEIDAGVTWTSKKRSTGAAPCVHSPTSRLTKRYCAD